MKENISDIIDQLQHQMYGYNYQVTLGIDILDNCKTLDDFKNELKKKYPNCRPESSNLFPIDYNEMLQDINFGFDYRGDNASGLKLSDKQEQKLSNLQVAYIDFIKHHIKQDNNIYIYSDEQGIPGYPVWWDYRFAIQKDNDSFVFIYGSASD